MTKDMGSVVTRELEGSIPASTITADGIVRAGRRRVLGRRLGFGGAFVTGIAALTAGILLLQPGGTGLPTATPSVSGSAESPAPPPQEEQPSFPLPDLDWENDSYDWDYERSEQGDNAETAVLTERLWQWISAREDLELFYFNGFNGETETITRANFPGIVRVPQNLVEDLEPDAGTYLRGPETGYQRPVYVLDSGPDIGTDVRWGFPDAPNDALIELAFYPKGSYLPDAESTEAGPTTPDVRHLVSGCEDYRYSGQGGGGGKLADFSCDDATGPGGERILTVECVIDADSAQAQKMITVVVYRPSGNAVVINGSAINREDGSFHRGQGPILTADDMAALVLSMPDLIVK